MNKALIFDIHRCSFSDGPGIRTTVFFKGCNLNCPWCHNPESKKTEKEVLFYEDKCKHCDVCKRICPNSAKKVCGTEYTPEEVFLEAIKDKAFYEASGGGVTFSGGECMLRADFLKEVLMLLKEEGIHTAIDTAGHIPFESFEKVLPYTDLFLYDIKILDSIKHKKYIGVGNELILKNLFTLLERGKSAWIRIPIIKGVNDSIEEIRGIKELFKENKPEKIELLPYHKMGIIKGRALGVETQEFLSPTKEEIKALENEINLP